MELLAVTLCLYNVPRPFSHIAAVVVYIPRGAEPTVACDVIQDAVAEITLQHPDALVVIFGDLNHVDYSSHSTGFDTIFKRPHET